MKTKTITPAEAFEKLVDNFSSTDFLWILTTLTLTMLIFYISLIKIRKETSNWKDVVFWFISILGWIFAFVVFGYSQITSAGYNPLIFMALSFILSSTSIVTVMKTNNDWLKIASSVIIGIIGFGMSISLIIGDMTYLYAIGFGFLLGLMIGRLMSAIQKMTPEFDDTEHDDKWSNSEFSDRFSSDSK